MSRRRRAKPKLLTLDFETKGPRKPAKGIRVQAFYQSGVVPVPKAAKVLAEIDKRRTGQPPDFSGSTWAAASVEFALRGALRVLAAMPAGGPIGPASVKSAWPDWVRDYAGEPGVSRLRPTARQVDQAERLAPLFRTIEPERVRRGIMAYCAGLSWAKVKQIAGDHRTPYHLRGRVYRAAFQRLANQLNDQNRLLPSDVADVPFFGL